NASWPISACRVSSWPSATSTSVPSEARASSSSRSSPANSGTGASRAGDSSWPRCRMRGGAYPRGSGRAAGRGLACPNFVMVSQHPPVEATPPLVRRAGAAVLVLTGLLALASGPVDATGADTMVHPGPPTVDGATSDLAGARAARTGPPTWAGATSALPAPRPARPDAMTRQATLQTQLAAARAEISDLDAE